MEMDEGERLRRSLAAYIEWYTYNVEADDAVMRDLKEILDADYAIVEW